MKEIDHLSRKIVSRKVSIVELLERAFGIKVEEGKPFSCPFPDHPSSQDKNPSAICNHKGNHVYCFAESRVYDVVDVLLICGVSKEKILGLAVREDLPRADLKADKHLLEKDRLIFQDVAETKIRSFRKGRATWKECFEVITEYLIKVSEG